jgi:hypothetical protein
MSSYWIGFFVGISFSVPAFFLVITIATKRATKDLKEIGQLLKERGLL